MIIKSKFGNYTVEFKNYFNENKKQKYFYLVDSFFKKKNIKLKETNTIYIKASEKAKSYIHVSTIINKLLKKNIDKNSIIVCIGGGTLQDITSFIAHILFRGISWIFIPTTLLAQSDSCIGSKISINFKGVKNILGGYYPPQKIYINQNFLKSLKEKDLLSGLGEMAHYYYLSDKNKFNFFTKNIHSYFDKKNIELDKMIKKSLKIKQTFIENDELEKNIRIYLNYGHSFGHAIEAISNFKIPHGIAVCFGLQIANYISFRLGFLSLDQLFTLQKPLKLISKNYNLKKYNELEMIKILKKDKKTINNKIRLILIKNIGKPFIKKFEKDSLLLKYLLDFKKFNLKYN